MTAAELEAALIEVGNDPEALDRLADLADEQGVEPDADDAPEPD